MRPLDKFEYPPELQSSFRKAKRLEWITIGYLLSTAILVYFTMGNSQAMKIAWFEDLLSLTYDQTFIGNPWPKYSAGFTNNFSYKGFDLSMLITSTIGNDIYNWVRNENSNPNNINLGRNLFAGALDYARVGVDAQGNPTLLNPGTTVARMSGGNRNNNFGRHTDKYVEDGSFVRLKNVTLTYNLPTTLVSRLKYIGGARIGASAQNIWTITGYSGYDPEVGSHVGGLENPNNAAIGVDYGRYPLTPMYSVNIGIDF